jgi:hypothetical protein
MPPPTLSPLLLLLLELLEDLFKLLLRTDSVGLGTAVAVGVTTGDDAECSLSYENDKLGSEKSSVR